MAIVEVQRRETPQVELPRRPLDRTVRVLAGSYFGKALGGICVVVLSILGLAGLAAGTLASVAVMVLGAALLGLGGSVLYEFNRLAERAGYLTRARLEAGSLTLSVAGLAGIILGVVALLGFFPVTLVAAADIAYGLALILGAIALYDIESALPRREERAGETIPGLGLGMAGFGVLAGLGTLILGILAVSGVSSVALNLVALLCAGSAVTLSGIAHGASFVKRF